MLHEKCRHISSPLSNLSQHNCHCVEKSCWWDEREAAEANALSGGALQPVVENRWCDTKSTHTMITHRGTKQPISHDKYKHAAHVLMHHFAGIVTEDKVRHTHQGRATTYIKNDRWVKVVSFLSLVLLPSQRTEPLLIHTLVLMITVI